MRRIALMLTMLAALGLAACNNSSSGGGGSAEAKVAHSVSGSIGLMSPRKLSDKSSMTIELVDASADGGQPLASKTIAPVGQMPMQFTLDFDAGKINPAHIYLVKVDLTDGQRTFSMPVQAPVITRDAPASQVQIMLAANKTPAEQLEDEYASLQKNLGAFGISNGRQLDKDMSRGWQTFRNKGTGDIVFVRENVDYGKKGFSNSEYAYKNGSPWFIVVKDKSSQNAKPKDIKRVGWDAEGKLVVNEDTASGKSSELSDADVAALKKQAVQMFKLAQSKLPANSKR